MKRGDRITHMRIVTIDHINIAGSPALVSACRTFYVDVLGLREGERPPFSSRGFWLYAGESPVVHLTEKSDHATGDTGSLDHFAFRCEGVAEAVERLKLHGIEYEISGVPGTTATQLFLRDPAGIELELNFAITRERLP